MIRSSSPAAFDGRYESWLARSKQNEAATHTLIPRARKSHNTACGRSLITGTIIADRLAVRTPGAVWVVPETQGVHAGSPSPPAMDNNKMIFGSKGMLITDGVNHSSACAQFVSCCLSLWHRMPFGASTMRSQYRRSSCSSKNIVVRYDPTPSFRSTVQQHQHSLCTASTVRTAPGHETQVTSKAF